MQIGGFYVRFVDIPSDNNWYDPQPIMGVVLHGTDGPLQASINWLVNPLSEVSANFVISKAGVIYRLVNFELGLRAWANGIVENYDHTIKWLDSLVKQRKNPNRYTVSIEHEAAGTEMINHSSMPKAQFDASIELTAYILASARLKASNQTVIGHYQISGTKKIYCPGVIFPPAYVEVLQDRHKELKG
jgi:N-acetyl-anhydromuramyl-L-alanine amidase AmpD